MTSMWNWSRRNVVWHDWLRHVFGHTICLRGVVWSSNWWKWLMRSTVCCQWVLLVPWAAWVLWRLPLGTLSTHSALWVLWVLWVLWPMGTLGTTKIFTFIKGKKLGFLPTHMLKKNSRKIYRLNHFFHLLHFRPVQCIFFSCLRPLDLELIVEGKRLFGVEP